MADRRRVTFTATWTHSGGRSPAVVGTEVLNQATQALQEQGAIVVGSASGYAVQENEYDIQVDVLTGVPDDALLDVLEWRTKRTWKVAEPEPTEAQA